MVENTDSPSEFTNGTESLNRSKPLASETSSRASTTVSTPRRTPAASTKSSSARKNADTANLVGVFLSGAPFIALVAAVETLIATVLLGVASTVAPLVVALVTFAVYTVDHVSDADADAASTPQRALLARRYGDQLMIAAALGYGIAVALAIAGGPLALAITLLPGAFWVVYASDWLPDLGQAVSTALSAAIPRGRIGAGVGAKATDGGHRRIPRLKDVLVLNSLVVATGWAAALTFLPVAFAGATVEPVLFVVFTYFLLRSFVDAELPNVRDVDADAAVGVETLPVVFGVDRTRLVLYGVDLLVAVLVAGAAVAGLLAWPLVVALGIGLAASLFITSLAGRVGDASVLGVAPDSTYLLIGVAIVGVRLVA
ncbi:UbiA family prenyltransferase [Halorubrum sp. HHNYT27]|uniref:UbiA family prenyltransferase n=1 Tax=Halorubrum sp. HHNYT27 TaxID=3402275 RepID=UPI003EB91CCB